MPCHDIIQERGEGVGEEVALQPVEVGVAGLLVLVFLLVEGSPEGAGRVVGRCWGSVAVRDGGGTIVVCWVAAAVTRLLVLQTSSSNISWLVRSVLSPPCLSPCDCRMFYRRHRLRQGRSSQRPEHRSCRMLAGSSKYARYYQAGEGTDIPGQALRNCPLDWCSRLGGHSGSTNTRSAVWSEQSEMFKTSEWSFWSIRATSSK